MADEHKPTPDSHDMIKGLSIEARVLKLARRLPVDRKLSDDQIRDVIAVYVGFVAEHEISDARVGKQVGYSASVISQWKRGKYDKGDIQAVTRAINNWLEREAKKRHVAIPISFVPTEIAEDMRTLIDVAISDGAMAAIVAPSGAGKTMVLQVMAEQSRGFYLYCDEDYQAKAFIVALAHTVGVPNQYVGAGNSISQIKRNIVEKLRGSGRPIFLDEAHLLPRAVFARIRSIHDQTKVPIVLAGTHEIIDRISDQSGGRGQWASRCYSYNAMDYVYDAEDPDGGGRLGRPLFTIEEIKRVFAGSQIRLDKGGLQMLWALACLPGRGCLRTAHRALSLAGRRWPGETIGRKHLRAAMQLTHGSRGTIIAAACDRHIKNQRKVA